MMAVQEPSIGSPRSVLFHRLAHSGGETCFIFQSEKPEIGRVGLESGEQIISGYSDRRSADLEVL